MNLELQGAPIKTISKTEDPREGKNPKSGSKFLSQILWSQRVREGKKISRLLLNGKMGWAVEKWERAKIRFLMIEQVSHAFSVGEGGSWDITVVFPAKVWIKKKIFFKSRWRP